MEDKTPEQELNELRDEVVALEHFLQSNGWQYMRGVMVSELGSIMQRAMNPKDPYDNMRTSGEMKAYDALLKLPEQRLTLLKRQLKLQSHQDEE